MSNTDKQGRQNPSRVRDHLANERTYLAWMRSAIALMGFGVVIVRLRYFQIPQVHRPGTGWKLGLLFALIGLMTVLGESITVADRTFTFCAATIGNPHCIIQLPEVTPEIAKQYGSLLEVHPYFPKRTNVQFMKVLDRRNIAVLSCVKYIKKNLTPNPFPTREGE